MTSLEGLLRVPELTDLELLAPGDLGRPVRSVTLAESLTDLDRWPVDALVLLSRAAAKDVSGYRLDVALRRASRIPVPALVVPTEAGFLVPPASAEVARRAGVSVLRVPASADLAQLAAAVERELSAGAARALARVERGLEAVSAAETRNGTVDAILSALAAVLPGSSLRDPAPDDLSAPILVDGSVEGHVSVRSAGNVRDAAARALLQVTAGAAGRTLAAARKAEEAPVRSRADLLTELLASDPGRSPGLLARARSLGLPIDGWHVVARIEVESTAAEEADEVAAFELGETISRIALRAARATGGSWQVARSETATLLLRMFDEDPGARAIALTVRGVEGAVAQLRRRFPARRMVAGVGGVHAGPSGLKASSAEARGAVGAARAGGHGKGVASFDAVGLRRMLVEWYASDSARESVDTLLGPLERLPKGRRETAIHTLQTYLDEQGSIARTARALHLHRNAVAYRIRRISDLLEVDLGDPDQRLALQLACRARMLTWMEPESPAGRRRPLADPSREELRPRATRRKGRRSPAPPAR